MSTDAVTVNLSGISVAQTGGASLRSVEDSILIISSIVHTAHHHRELAKLAVQEYRRVDKRDDRPKYPGRVVRTEAEEFTIPASAGAGNTLASALVEKLRRCVGAIAFVDEMRPNIAYELGFFHGMGRRVLLLSSITPQPSWTSITDLAGIAIQQFTEENLTAIIHRYLSELFLHIEMSDHWPTYTFPNPRHNLLSQRDLGLRCSKMELSRGRFGKSVKIFEWEHPLNIRINRGLSEDARFKIAIRSPDDAHFSVYFEIAFRDAESKPRQVWLGLNSWLERADFCRDERNIPTDAATSEWRFVAGTFAELQRQGHLAKLTKPVLKRVRFRAGEPNSNEPSTLEIGYVEITGFRSD